MRQLLERLRPSAMDLARPIFIWGVPRSGTHLLYDILSLHPSLACPTTPQRAKKGLWGSMHWGDETPPALRGRPAPHEGFDRFWMGAGIRYDSIGLFDRSRLDPSLVAAVRARYADLRRDWAWGGGARFRILDKCPTYLLMVDAIDAVFPDSIHIYLIRDPRSVLNSLLRIYRFPEKGRGQIDEIGFATGVPPGHERHREEPVADRLAWQIAALMDLARSCERRLGERVIAVHYESVVAEPHGTAEDLLARLDLPRWAALRELVPPAFKDYAPPWPAPGAPVTEPPGRRRCWMDEDRPALETVEQLARGLGYEANQPGRLSVPVAGAERDPVGATS